MSVMLNVSSEICDTPARKDDTSAEIQPADEKQDTKTDRSLISPQSERTDADVSHISCDKPIVIVASPEKALWSSKMESEQQYRQDAYELSFWTDASLPGRKTGRGIRRVPAMRQGLCTFCVVHRRWDVQHLQPGEPGWDTTWWLSGFAATGAAHPWQAEAMAVIQALRMAVDHCERASGMIVSPGRNPSALKRISAGLPTRVNIFSDHSKILESLGGVSVHDDIPRNHELIQISDELLKRLGTFRVGVSLRWVPGHAGDVCTYWAYQGSRMAMEIRVRYLKTTRHPETQPKSLHRVMLKARGAKCHHKAQCTSSLASDADERK